MATWKGALERVRWGWVALAAFGLLLAIQIVPVARTNPPVESDVGAPAPVATILRRACYDCHSHETRWAAPQAYVAPASWLVAHDVNEGRQDLNFSRWASYDSARLARKVRQIKREVEEGEMPPLHYRLLHPQAQLSEADRAAVAAWASGL